MSEHDIDVPRNSDGVPYEDLRIKCYGPNGEYGHGQVQLRTLDSCLSWTGPTQDSYTEVLFDYNSSTLDPNLNAPKWLLIRQATEPRYEDFGATAIDTASQARILTGVQAYRWFRKHDFTPPAACQKQVGVFPNIQARVSKSYQAAGDVVEHLCKSFRDGKLHFDEAWIARVGLKLWLISAALLADQPRIPPHPLPGMQERPDSLGSWIEHIAETANRAIRNWRMANGHIPIPGREDRESQQREFASRRLQEDATRIAKWDATRLHRLLGNEQRAVSDLLDIHIASTPTETNPEDDLIDAWAAQDEAADRAELEAEGLLQPFYATLRAIDSVVLDPSIRFQRGDLGPNIENVGDLMKGITLDPLEYAKRIIDLVHALEVWPTLIRCDAEMDEPVGRGGQLGALLFRMARDGAPPEKIASAFSNGRMALRLTGDSRTFDDSESGVLRFFCQFFRYKKRVAGPTRLACLESVKNWEDAIDSSIAKGACQPIVAEETPEVTEQQGAAEARPPDDPLAGSTTPPENSTTLEEATPSPPEPWRHPIESIDAVIDVLEMPDHKRCGWKRALVALIDLAQENPTAPRWALTSQELLDHEYSRVADPPNRVARVRSMMTKNIPELAAWVGLDTAPTLSAIYLRAKVGSPGGK